jgi:hypothetical protein
MKAESHRPAAALDAVNPTSDATNHQRWVARPFLFDFQPPFGNAIKDFQWAAFARP